MRRRDAETHVARMQNVQTIRNRTLEHRIRDAMREGCPEYVFDATVTGSVGRPLPDPAFATRLDECRESMGIQDAETVLDDPGDQYGLRLRDGGAPPRPRVPLGLERD